ncbi:hypothetical protein EG867_15785 [Enterococcus faecalis]|nr:hypothetical protein EG867_15785 [Enterococcus faecalis]
MEAVMDELAWHALPRLVCEVREVPGLIPVFTSASVTDARVEGAALTLRLESGETVSCDEYRRRCLAGEAFRGFAFAVVTAAEDRVLSLAVPPVALPHRLALVRRRGPGARARGRGARVRRLRRRAPGLPPQRVHERHGGGGRHAVVRGLPPAPALRQPLRAPVAALLPRRRDGRPRDGRGRDRGQRRRRRGGGGRWGRGRGEEGRGGRAQPPRAGGRRRGGPRRERRRRRRWRWNWKRGKGQRRRRRRRARHAGALPEDDPHARGVLSGHGAARGPRRARHRLPAGGLRHAALLRGRGAPLSPARHGLPRAAAPRQDLVPRPAHRPRAGHLPRHPRRLHGPHPQGHGARLRGDPRAPAPLVPRRARGPRQGREHHRHLPRRRAQHHRVRLQPQHKRKYPFFLFQ